MMAGTHGTFPLDGAHGRCRVNCCIKVVAGVLRGSCALVLLPFAAMVFVSIIILWVIFIVDVVVASNNIHHWHCRYLNIYKIIHRSIPTPPPPPTPTALLTTITSMLIFSVNT